MEHSKSFVFTALALFLFAGVALAQEAMEAPQPTAEHEALGAFVGSWEGQGELEPGPFGPGGPMKWTEDCAWFGGTKFHVVCKSDGMGPMGPTKGLGIMGYDAAKKVYTHYGVDSSGWAGYAEGGRSGDTWSFSNTETVEGKTYHSRFSMQMSSPTAMKFKWEMSEDGKTWTTMMDGTTKKK
jgi:hypothetical protein